MFLIGDIIELAIQIEQNAENVYRHALKKISSPKLVSILQWLADEEVEHAKWFQQLKQTVNTEVKDPAVEAMGKSILSEVLGSQSFSLKQADFGEMSQLEDLISLAAEFEKDKVIFYKMLRPFIEDRETLDFLENIIDQETNHIRELSTLMDRYAAQGKITSET
jgi:rubrerythrin